MTITPYNFILKQFNNKKQRAVVKLLDRTTKKALEEKLKLESFLVSQESLNVLKEFESI